MENFDDRSKRPKLDIDSGSPTRAGGAVIRLQRAAFLSTLSRAVSPPLRSTNAEQTLIVETASEHEASREQQIETSTAQTPERSRTSGARQESRQVTEQMNLPRTLRVAPSPFQLVEVADPSYPARYNHDTITIKDILGDPLIKQAWMFNYLFDVDWVMQQFDPDTRELVEVTIIHGFWKRESENKLAIDEACSRYPNVRARTAWLEDPFGTHHTKMFILFRHDDCAQVVIHTANMIQKDWSNMTDAVWRSPQLPLRSASNAGDSRAPLGSGQRFKHGLIEYLKAYGEKTTAQVVKSVSYHDFASVRGALIGSVPGQFSTDDWGCKAIRRATSFLQSRNNLSIVNNTRKRQHESISTSTLSQPSNTPASSNPRKLPSHLVIQVSSVASLPASWLSTFLAALGAAPPATWSLVYPTVHNIRASLYGYYSGGSVFMKTTSTTANQNQLASLRPHLCHWATPDDAGTTKEAGRGPAAPHIKTYICFASRPSKAEPKPNIEWALLTSANLSRQAWGVEGKGGKGLKISSYELGVMVWPGLYLTDEEVEAGTKAKMVPCFGRDAPEPDEAVGEGVAVGLRMPYDLPLTPYGSGEMPWDGGREYRDADRRGKTWPP